MTHFHNNYLNRLEIKINKDIAKFSDIKTDIDYFGNNRKTGVCTQFSAIF